MLTWIIGVDRHRMTSTPHPEDPPMPKRHFLPLVLAGALLAAGTAAAHAATATAAVTVGTGTGATLPDDFVGFSFEANVLAGTAPSAGNLAQYMSTLGPGVTRFGGNFVDSTFW